MSNNNLKIVNNQLIKKMGTECSMENNQPMGQMVSNMATFVEVEDVQIPDNYTKLLIAIKSVIEFYDARKNQNLKWYQSVKHKFYIYGQVKKGKPVGQCFVYSKNPQNNHTPAIVATKITNQYTFSQQTLIVYSDRSYYHGQIFSRSYQLPRASGRGLLVTEDFIYQGQFKDGYPNGYGIFRTKALQFTGTFKDGQPLGQGVERSQSGLFIGQVLANKNRVGNLITPQNKVEPVNEVDMTNQTRSQTGEQPRRSSRVYSPHQHL